MFVLTPYQCVRFSDLRGHLLTECLATHPNYTKYADLLDSGWIPGRKVVRSTKGQEEIWTTS